MKLRVRSVARDAAELSHTRMSTLYTVRTLVNNLPRSDQVPRWLGRKRWVESRVWREWKGSVCAGLWVWYALAQTVEDGELLLMLILVLRVLMHDAEDLAGGLECLVNMYSVIDVSLSDAYPTFSMPSSLLSYVMGV